MSLLIQHRVSVLLGVVAIALSEGLVLAGTPLNFNRQIRPILSEFCFRCHGPDGTARQAGLRLDRRDSALAKLESGAVAIIPGSADKSAVIRRICSDNDDERMPPPEFGKRLTGDQAAILSKWINQGAPWAEHWAYVKPKRSSPPAVVNSKWPRNAIDSFVLARLEHEKLFPSVEADKTAILRRVTFDLIGLPPSLADLDAFIADDSADAYEKVVDRLLASPRYGEHWARKWLDLARYADSAGYADDPPRNIWLFRDYVIESFNANKPFDQFTIEQIAGDLLPEATEAQRIATAFHRNTLTNNEGGTDNEEFRNVAVVDRVNTTMSVWMGTTIACAQCHTHKYDPISQEEYFRLFAFFNNTEDADRQDEAPLLEIYTREQRQEQERLQHELTLLEQLLRTSTPELQAAQRHWEERFRANWSWQVLVPTIVKSQAGVTTAIGSNGEIHIGPGAKNDVYAIEIMPPIGTLGALQLEALPSEALPGKGPGYGNGNFVVSKISATLVFPVKQPAEGEANQTQIEFAAAAADYMQAGFDPQAVLGKVDPATGWAIGGKTGHPHALTISTKLPVEIPAGAKLIVTIEHASSHANHTLGHFRLSATAIASAIEYAQVPVAIAEVLCLPVDQRTLAQSESVALHFLATTDELAPQRKQHAELKRQLSEIKPNTVPVMRELPAGKRRITKLQHRGNFLDFGQEVSAGTPAAFPSLPANSPADRLALARWLVDQENPLTARVVANRYWEQIFGTGIVLSSEDFGSQGDLPSHPELLDWLATELINLQWDTKALVKLMVTSATYRQSSRVSEELTGRDADNRLLARGPRIRLSAEEVRDQALFVSGLLSSKVGGPSVNPPQPALGLAAAFGSSVDWKTSEGEDRYRRALYTSWRRSNPYPSMAAFDATSREVCTVRRGSTNTPLQALVTLNDPVYIEAAQALARRMSAQGGPTPAERIRYGFRLCLARTPTEAETGRLLKLYQNNRERFEEQSEDARRLATDPLGPPPADATNAELAAWTVVANTLLNLDETLMKR